MNDCWRCGKKGEWEYKYFYGFIENTCTECLKMGMDKLTKEFNQKFMTQRGDRK